MHRDDCFVYTHLMVNSFKDIFKDSKTSFSILSIRTFTLANGGQWMLLFWSLMWSRGACWGAQESAWWRVPLPLFPYGKRHRSGERLLLPQLSVAHVNNLLQWISNTLSNELQKYLNSLFVLVLKSELLSKLPKCLNHEKSKVKWHVLKLP